jgi:NSS family neurotransmitter:Na+ symporter
LSQPDAGAAREQWSSRWTFLFATLGSAIGLGNLWRFPYMAGENGGGAFVIVYFLFAFVICAPLIMAELALGRRTQRSPVGALQFLCAEARCSRVWRAIGWISVLNPLLALCFYSVVAGWSLAYIVKAALGAFTGIAPEQAAAEFADLLASPAELFFWYTLYLGANVFFIARGIRRGIEFVNNFMLPSLFVLLAVLAVYAHVYGDAARGWRFLFAPDFARVTGQTLLMALGQALFSVSVATGALLTYGSHMRRNVGVIGSSWVIAGANLLSALLAGLAIFPVVFASGLDPDGGPGLMFVTLPLALGSMPFSWVFSVAFFVLVFFAAFTSSLGMFQPFVGWVAETGRWPRAQVAVWTGVAVWIVGVTAVLSFNIWQDFHPLAFIPLFADRNFFGILDYTVSNVFLPLNAVLIALFVGWVYSRDTLRAEIGIAPGLGFALWNFGVRYLAPVALGGVLIYSLIG